MKKLDRNIIKYILFIALIVLLVLNYQQIISWLGYLWLISSPVFIGAMIAYVLNILMVKFENIWFPNSNHLAVRKSRRPMSIVFALLTITIVLFVVVGLVVPQVISVVATLIEVIPKLVQQVQGGIDNYERVFPLAADLMDQFNFDWGQMVQNAVTFINSLTSRILETTIAALGSVTSVLINLFLSLIISIYILMSKEKLGEQFNRIVTAYLPERYSRKFFYVVGVLDESFKHFITGEVIEAFILGSMVTAGMWIFRFPYAGMIGALTGLLALIPMLGAYLSGAIGFILIGVQSPAQGFAFLIFIAVIQQIEGNFIYPKVVGDSIGLPGMWVLISVTIGGGLAGVTGMLLGVPIASAIYKLIKYDVAEREDLVNRYKDRMSGPEKENMVTKFTFDD